MWNELYFEIHSILSIEPIELTESINRRLNVCVCMNRVELKIHKQIHITLLPDPIWFNCLSCVYIFWWISFPIDRWMSKGFSIKISWGIWTYFGEWKTVATIFIRQKQSDPCDLIKLLISLKLLSIYFYSCLLFSNFWYSLCMIYVF